MSDLAVGAPHKPTIGRTSTDDPVRVAYIELVLARLEGRTADESGGRIQAGGSDEQQT